MELMPRNRMLLVHLAFVYAAVVLVLAAYDSRASSDVLVLTDANLEHDTQAASGATTGGWLIKFYAEWCGHCKHLAPTWEQVASDLKGEVNVAKLDSPSNPRQTKRFQIRGYPTVLFLKDGHAYKYKGNRKKEDLIAFVRGSYKTAESFSIPRDTGITERLFTDLEELYVKVRAMVQERLDVAVVLGTIGLIGGVLVSMLAYFCSSRASSKPKQS